MSRRNKHTPPRPATQQAIPDMTGGGVVPGPDSGVPQHVSSGVQTSVEALKGVISDTKPFRTITTCAGIGDSIWLMQKLLNLGEKFNFIIPDGTPQRGKQLFDLMPQVASSCTYAPNLSYKKIKADNVGKGNWAAITAKEFTLSANEHLESGRRIENFLPDLKTSFSLEYATDENDKGIARVLLPAEQKYIGIYTSKHDNAANWNGWQAGQWLALVKLLAKTNAAFVLIGASYDVGIPEELMPAMDELKIPYVNTIGQPLSVVVEVLKRLSYFIGFPSGLSILNETLGKDGTMMYPKHLAPMMNAWAHPDRISNHNYKGCVFPEPEKLYDWLKDTYKIFDKI